MNSVSKILGYAFCFAFMLRATAGADEIQIAVASNFVAPLKVLAERFEKQTGHQAVISSESSGKIYAQIKNGAPYDLFFSADSERPQKLEAEGLTVPGSRFTYSVGKLALWSADAKLVDAKGEVLSTGKFLHLAVANPETAPYGHAAKQVLERMNLWDKVTAKLVKGESIAQTFQFIDTGGAELGFVALSQVLENKGKNKGSFWLVPKEMHDPIFQQAVELKSESPKTAAGEFLKFVKTAESRTLIEKSGYAVP